MTPKIAAGAEMSIQVERGARILGQFRARRSTTRRASGSESLTR